MLLNTNVFSFKGGENKKYWNSEDICIKRRKGTERKWTNKGGYCPHGCHGNPVNTSHYWREELSVWDNLVGSTGRRALATLLAGRQSQGGVRPLQVCTGSTYKISLQEARMSLPAPLPPVSTHVVGHPPESSDHWGPIQDSDIESPRRGCHRSCVDCR